MSDEVTAWLKSGEYLPDFLRDFHDQKDVFKAVHEVVERRKDDTYTRDLNWVAAHVYTIDVFLWMMARHGYTLQKARKKIKFSDIHEFVASSKDRRNNAAAKLLGLTPLST